ncbi:MAG: helix-turn-helix domain-containing protein, partial [Bifidobacteriaceae bacterium]|nr:helix-turn-helix domain-containing protein [Bifidobacteriaceae bacterium]
MTKSIAQQLREIVVASRWTQEQLAYNLGVTFVTLNSWINAKSQPRTKARLKIDEMY